MSKLAKIKAKYSLSDGAKHEPKSGCAFCQGSGERPIKSQPGKLTFCLCLYVDHDLSDKVGKMLSEFASRQIAKLQRDSGLGE